MGIEKTHWTNLSGGKMIKCDACMSVVVKPNHITIHSQVDREEPKHYDFCSKKCIRDHVNRKFGEGEDETIDSRISLDWRNKVRKEFMIRALSNFAKDKTYYEGTVTSILKHTYLSYE